MGSLIAAPRSDRLLYDYTVLAIFLAFSLATQAPSFGAQVRNEHAMIAIAQGVGLGLACNTDFDDDRRGLKSLVLSSVYPPTTFGAPGECFHVSDIRLDFRFAGVPLFKLHAALLI
ncbi:MAG TPA: hypothetical protein VFX54_18970 [Candidatus Binatia bacterium]|nr:hypothetical protein [Candidatus Binatia bacterium]